MTAVKQKSAGAKKSATAAQQPFPKGVSQPAIRALASAGYTSLAQLEKASEAELASLHGMGPKAMGIIRAALLERGKSFLP
jgi:DNA uptake protein ComE-like DNA-binding protein